MSSNRSGTQEGTAHLLAVGHRRIGFIGDLPVGLYTRRERLVGYRAALAGAGVSYDRSLVVSSHDQGASAAATERLLDLAEPPTALLAGNNFTAMGAVTALARRRVLSRLDGDRTRPRAEVVPTRLVLRGSGELPPR